MKGPNFWLLSVIIGLGLLTQLLIKHSQILIDIRQLNESIDFYAKKVFEKC